MNEEQEQEWRAEAERLRVLPRKVQREIIALHRSTADDPNATKADREFARRRADALEKFLRLSKK